MRALLAVLCLAVSLSIPAVSEASVTAGSTGWSWVNPVPQGEDLNAVRFAGGRGIAAGVDGLVLRTEDAGLTWSAVPSGTESDLTELAMPDASTIYVGGGCTLRRSTDGGLTFTRVAFTSRRECQVRLSRIAFPTASVGYLFLSDGTVLRTTNGGRSFTRRAPLAIGSSVPQGGAADAEFTSETTGVVATGQVSPAFLRTEDGGQSWTGIAVAQPPNTYPELRAVDLDFATPLVGYAVDDRGPSPLLKTVDGGKTWTRPALTGAIGVPHSVSCPTEMACVIVSGDQATGFGNRVVWTADGGLTGTPVGVGNGVLDLAFSSLTRAVAVGGGGLTLASDDVGHTFARVGSRLVGDFAGLRGLGGEGVLAFAADGSVARSTDGGFVWAPLGVSPLGGLLDIAFATPAVAYALTGDGTLERSDDAGASWAVLPAELEAARALLATAPDEVLVATIGGVMRSTDGGATLALAPGARRDVRAFDRAGTALVAFGRRALLVSADGGANWRSLRRPRGRLRSVDFVSARTGFLVRTDGDVFATRDGGRSWRLLTGVGRDDIAHVAFGSARQGFLMLARNSGLGGVLRTSDGGRSWRPQVLSKRPLADLVAIDGTGGVALGRGDGHLFATHSGGDAGARSALTLRLLDRRRARNRVVVTVGGRLRPAPVGAGVSVTARIAGRWVRKFAPVGANGRYSTVWRLRRGAIFVAQWRGAPGVQSDGTAPLAIALRGHRRR